MRFPTLQGFKFFSAEFNTGAVIFAGDFAHLFHRGDEERNRIAASVNRTETDTLITAHLITGKAFNYQIAGRRGIKNLALAGEFFAVRLDFFFNGSLFTLESDMGGDSLATFPTDGARIIDKRSVA